jgi:hypothetical protein
MPRSLACLIVAAATALASLACGDEADHTEATSQPRELPLNEPPNWGAYQNAVWGYSVGVPPGWHYVAQPRTPRLGDPAVILALATFPLRDEDAAYPIARQGFAADEALVTLQERAEEPGGWSSAAFPKRPSRFHFEPDHGSVPADSVRRATGIDFRDHWFNFSDAGRYFHVQVAIGDAVPSGEAAEVYRILDTLRLDPSVKPDWASAG